MNSTLLQDRRVWIGGGVLVALLLVAASWMLLIGPKFDSADSLQSQSDDAQLSNQQVQASNNKLRIQADHMDELQDKLRTALAGLPAGSGFAEFTDEVTTLATQSKVKLTTITISPATEQAPTATAPSASSSDSSGSESAAPSAASPASGSGVLTIDVTLTSTGTGPSQNAFLSAVQNGDRRALVNSTQLSVAGTSRTNSVGAATTMTTQLTIFSAPMSVEQLRSIEKDLAAN